MVTWRIGRIAAAAVALTVWWVSLDAWAVQAAGPDAGFGRQVHLPALGSDGAGACASTITVESVGCTPTKALLLTWSEPGACPPECAGPMAVVCSGLLRPGSSWVFGTGDVPPTARSAVVYGVTARRLHELEVPPAPILADTVTADYLCQMIYYSVVADCHDYRRFERAWREGLAWSGVQLSAVRGAPLAVSVRRGCFRSEVEGLPIRSAYRGISDGQLGTTDPVFGGFGYFAPLIYGDHNGYASRLHLRNAGVGCASVSLWLIERDRCGRARICADETVAPGESIVLPVARCSGSGWIGSAWLRSTQPLAVLVDAGGRDVTMAYQATSSRMGYAWEGDVGGDPESHGGAPRTVHAPLTLHDDGGWETGVQIQNLSGIVPAKVKIHAIDRGGQIVASLVDWICPRGSRTFYLPAISGIPSGWVGRVRVDSVPYAPPGESGPSVAPPEIAGVVQLMRYGDVGRTRPLSGAAYSMDPVSPGTRRPTETDAEGMHCTGSDAHPGCIGLLAIPSVRKGEDAMSSTTALMVTNMVEHIGATEVAIYLFDENGSIEVLCQRLPAGQSDYIDLASYAFLAAGFRGSALVSAVAWQHGAGDGPATASRRRGRVALAAAVLDRGVGHRWEWRPGDPGDAYSAVPISAGLQECSIDLLPACPRLAP